MELKRFKDHIEVWQTGRKENNCLYNSKEGILDTHRRNELSYIQDFLEKHKETSEVKRIGEHLGKLIKFKRIPQLIPVGNYKINTRLEWLNESMARYKKEYNLDLDPDFQRHHVWSMDQRVAFVEFILQGGQCPPIYFNYPNWQRGYSQTDKMVIVDGKQRLTSMLMFLDNQFPVFQKLDKEGIGFYAKDFDRISTDIEIVINDLATEEQVLEWYLQINKGQVAHTDEEIQKVEDMLSGLRK